jgi:succinate-acetate transporter protein
MTQDPETIVSVKDTLANPTPLGLLGFGMRSMARLYCLFIR